MMLMVHHANGRRPGRGSSHSVVDPQVPMSDLLRGAIRVSFLVVLFVGGLLLTSCDLSSTGGTIILNANSSVPPTVQYRFAYTQDDATEGGQVEVVATICSRSWPSGPGQPMRKPGGSTSRLERGGGRAWWEREAATAAPGGGGRNRRRRGAAAACERRAGADRGGVRGDGVPAYGETTESLP